MNEDAIAQARAWYWQRISAMVLAVFVVIHLVIMMYAIRGGLSAAEILDRTQGSLLIGVFYGLFVLACAVHVPIGIAKIVQEWGASPRVASRLSQLFAAVIVIMGLAAVWGVSA